MKAMMFAMLMLYDDYDDHDDDDHDDGAETDNAVACDLLAAARALSNVC